MATIDRQSEHPGESLERQFPHLYAQLLEIKERAERYFRDVCDIEFTIQEGQLFVLNIRPAKRTPRANLRFLLQFFSERKIGVSEVLSRVKPADVEEFTKAEILNRRRLLTLGRGLPACGTAATGEIVLDSTDVLRLTRSGRQVVLVKEEINPEDLDALRMSEGVLTARGGMTSHAAIVCRGWGKPCVVGFGEMHVDPRRCCMSVQGLCDLKEGDWITIDGVGGQVYAGKGNLTIREWRDQPELLALASIIELALATDDIPMEAVGIVWRLRDFFAHHRPLRLTMTSKKPTAGRPFVSFGPPKRRDVEKARSNLMRVRPEDRENYSEILLSLAETLSRLLSSALGIGEHHLYFRPLWDPREWVSIRGNEGGGQLVGFEYFGINRHVPHLVNISTMTFLLEFELRDESEASFLDFTNPDGESLVLSSTNVKAYSLLLDDAHVSYDDLPKLYHVIRHREYSWQFYEARGTSHREINEFLLAWSNHEPLNSSLLLVCSEIGLLRDGKLTASGESLLGKCARKQTYEHIGIQ